MIDMGIKEAFNARCVKHALRVYLLLVSYWRRKWTPATFYHFLENGCLPQEFK